jgi:hypothetical protein
MIKISQNAGFSYQDNSQIDQGSDQEWTTNVSCGSTPCNYEGGFLVTDKNKQKDYIEAMCPKCKDHRMFKINLTNEGPEKEGDKIKVYDEPIQSLRGKNNMSFKKESEKRDEDGILIKNKNKKPVVYRMHEDVNPENNTIGPFTEERENYKNESKVIQSASVITEKDLSENDLKTLEDGSKILTSNAKVKLAKEAAMYPQVSIMPASQNGACQWCPKLRSPVSMDICATKCIDGRRIPQKENETYQDYLISGGDPNGKVVCGYKEWLKREVDAYYPGWIEDRIKRNGGDVVGGDTNFGNRKMNLDEGEKRHLPRYPEEFLIEKAMEEEGKHKFEIKTRTVKEKEDK